MLSVSLLVGVLLVSLLIGRYPVSFFDRSDEVGRNIFWNIRLPRVIMAAVLGMVLSASGASLQSTFRNSLVGPGILGISQGAAFGATLAILFNAGSVLFVEVSATTFALIALGVTYAMSSFVRYGDRTLRLILAGLVSSALFSGGVGLMKYMADPLNQLPELTFWLLGGLSGVLWRDLLYAVPLSFTGVAILILFRWRLNLLTLDDDISVSLGVDPGRLKTVIVAAAVVSIAVVSSVAGIVNWIGLISPHLARKLVGVDNSRVIPTSAVMGATLTILFDDIARAISPSEIPLGVTVSLLGAPLFILLLSRREAAPDG